MKLPNYSFERNLLKKGFKFIAGVDEVGRGCFAGPVVAGCVVFDPKLKIPPDIEINDSKKVSPRRRQIANDWIKKNAYCWGIGEAGASLINRIGMGKATKVAFRRAIKDANLRLKGTIDFLLIDAFYIPYVKGLKKKNQKPIIDGDEKSFSIAAASIVAKVYRDKFMRRLSKKYPGYGWSRNKGYGTKAHTKAIKKLGLTRYHRKAFIKTFFKNSSLG